MSSFICSPKHFNSIEKKLYFLMHDRDFYFPYELKEKFRILADHSKESEEAIEMQISDLVDTLRELNAVCVSLQYSSHYDNINEEIATQTEILKKNKAEFKHLTNLGLYNALRCLNYQIEIEHLEENLGVSERQKDAMFFLDRMIDALARHIVNQMPEDKTNRWEVE